MSSLPRPSFAARLAAGVVLLAPVIGGGCARERNADEIRVSGHVEATEVRMSTKIAGTLLTLDVDEGDAVDRGRILGQIDTVDLELALRAAEAERADADAQLRLMRAGYREEDIAAAEAERNLAAAELDQAQKDLARMQGLLEAGSGTPKSRDDALARRDVDAARLRVAEETLRKLRAGYRPEEVDAARARLAAARARIDQLRQNIADATLKSPLRGIVTEKIAEAGELLPSGGPVVVITDLADAWLTVYVSEPDLPRIRIGQPARVLTDDGAEREGRIIFVSSDAEFTPKNVQTRDERVKLVFRVKIGLDNTDGRFKPGMPAVAVLAVGESAS